MERKKIILFATSDINYDQRLQKIASTLSEYSNDVLLVGRKLASSINLLKQSFKQKRWTCFFNSGPLFYLEFNLRIFLFLLKQKTDIVCANDIDTALGVCLASYFKSFDIYFDAHEYFTEVPELQNKNTKKKLWLLVEKWIVKRSRFRYTVNESLATIFKEKYNKDFQIIRNVPVKLAFKNKKNKGKFVLYQGALNKGRGLEVLIEVMQEISIPLKIAGKGDLERELKARVKELSLEPKVEFLGNLTPDKLRKITSEAFIGINILETTSLNYYYSSANKFFDYIHAELPQISMDFPEYSRMNKEDEVAFLLKNLESINLKNALHKMINDVDYYSILKFNCKKTKDKYVWTNEAVKLKKIYFGSRLAN